jgi:hypothetical protein
VTSCTGLGTDDNVVFLVWAHDEILDANALFDLLVTKRVGTTAIIVSNVPELGEEIDTVRGKSGVGDVRSIWIADHLDLELNRHDHVLIDSDRTWL